MAGAGLPLIFTTLPLGITIQTLFTDEETGFPMHCDPLILQNDELHGFKL